MGLSEYWLPVRVVLAVYDLVVMLVTLEPMRIYDLLGLLCKVKLHGRRVTRPQAAPWNVLVEWRKAVAEAPNVVFCARAEDSAELRTLTYADADALSDEFARWVVSVQPTRDGAVALVMGSSCEFLVAYLGVAKSGRAAALCNTTLRGDALAHALPNLYIYQ